MYSFVRATVEANSPGAIWEEAVWDRRLKLMTPTGISMLVFDPGAISGELAPRSEWHFVIAVVDAWMKHGHHQSDDPRSGVISGTVVEADYQIDPDAFLRVADDVDPTRRWAIVESDIGQILLSPGALQGVAAAGDFVTVSVIRLHLKAYF